jgi:peptide/nickel transport system permease protein
MSLILRKNIPTYGAALLIILGLNFFIPRMMPGDPLLAIYGEEALVVMTPEMKAYLLRAFALDRPLGEQFLAYLFQILHGNLGFSYYYNAATVEIILGRLPWTILLVGSALILSSGIGILLGIESGWRRGKVLDRSLLAGFMGLNGFPDFFLGAVLLLLFGVSLELFPLAGALSPYAGLSGISLLADVLWHLALPVSALTLGHVAANYLLTRNTMITVLKQPFILSARAKGLAEKTIRYRHAGRNSLLPLVTRTGIWLGRLITGTLFIEIIFAYPGLGTLTHQALLARDYVVLQGILLIVALLVLLVNLGIDLLYPRLDPRVQHAYSPLE